MTETQQTLRDLRALSLSALKRMYLPEEGLFCHCVRRTSRGDRPEGVSPRYTAITLIGLAGEKEDVCRSILGGQDRQDVCTRLIDRAAGFRNLGDAALTWWAALALEHESAPQVGRHVLVLDPIRASHPTVEVAWSLMASALALDPSQDQLRESAERIARRLLDSEADRLGIFPHRPHDAVGPTLRGHVACFADQVYPIQALAQYYRTTRNLEALAGASRCADRICELQGPGGQWWWHYDARTGQMLEGYPVYSVHQDAMAPMALFDLMNVSDQDHASAIALGMRWLIESPEIGGSLIDPDAGLIWRKVARHEPGKAARSLQAVASRVHPALRMPGLDSWLSPGAIDHECRPYHLGWLLYAWPADRVESFHSQTAEVV